MSAALVVLVASALAGEWDWNAGVDATTRGGVTPIAAGIDPISQVRVEAEPRLGVTYTSGRSELALTYRPRIVQRFLLAPITDLRGVTRTATLTGPLVMNQLDLGGHLQATRRVRLDSGVSVGFGTLAYNDAALFGSRDPANPGPSTDATVLEVQARASIAYVTDADRDTLRFGVIGSVNRIIDDLPATVGAADRTRINGFASYTFNPSRVDAIELAATTEVALYEQDPSAPPLLTNQTSVVGVTGGWIRTFSRRVRCAARGGAVALFSAGDPSFAPSGGADCTIDTYRSAGLRVTGAFAASVIGSTSAVTAAAEPRILSSLDFRFMFPPDKGLRIAASFTAPIRVDPASAPPPEVSDAVFELTVPFSWQVQPGLDVIVGAGFGVRGRLDGNFDQIDAQGFAQLAWSYDSAGNSRYQRP